MSTTIHQGVAPRPRTSYAWIVILLAILAAVGVWAYMSTRPRPARVVQRDIVGMIPLNGDLVVPPSARADIAAPFRAPVEKVEVSVGQHVDRGDVLVQLSLPSVEVATQQAKDNLKAAETAYANAKRQYGAAVRAAGQQLEAARKSAQPPANNPDATGSGAPAGNPTSNSEGASSGVADTAAAQQGKQQAMIDEQSGLAPYRLQLEAARAAYQEAKSGAKISRIRAPISGTVLALNARPGAEVGADVKIPVATIVDLSKIQAQAEMTPDQAGYAKPKTPVLLSFNDLPGRQFEGTISNVTTKIESKAAGLIKTQKYVALIAFKNADGAVKPGMKPNVAIKLGEVKDAIAVPNDAIEKDGSGRPIVKVLRGGEWQPVVVEPGLTDGQYTQVKSGVQPGETVQVVPSILHAASTIR